MVGGGGGGGDTVTELKSHCCCCCKPKIGITWLGEGAGGGYGGRT